jgi:hypothetical protein
MDNPINPVIYDALYARITTLLDKNIALVEANTALKTEIYKQQQLLNYLLGVPKLEQANNKLFTTTVLIQPNLQLPA